MDLNKYNRKELYESFISAEPFHHIVLDNFIHSSFLEKTLEEIQNMPESKWYDNEYSYINNEDDSIVQSKKIALTNSEKMEPLSKNIMKLFESQYFIDFLQDITGIYGLQNDPYNFGGGIHRVKENGHLSIHADFNIHPVTNKYRRINALLYLNKDWKPEYNGNLELWTKDMNQCIHSIPPIFNRLVIFRITDDAFHGHPSPWLAPKGIDRLSFAFYYYTDDRPENEKSPPHLALWQQRYNQYF